MLSYQHAYHAGNLADVHKHGALAVLLARMKEKPRPITYVETHAGRGLYDLDAPEAKKTGEAKLGIDRCMKAGGLSHKHPYMAAIAATRAQHGARAYPGSPLIALNFLNPGSTMHLFELHPQEFLGLEQTIQGQLGQKQAHDLHIHAKKVEGFLATLDICPPQARRGLVLIDPSYEIKTDYMDCADFIVRLNQKWPEACVVLWYPILEAGLHHAMAEVLKTDLEAQGSTRLQRREVLFSQRSANHRILGSGLLILNAPFGTDKGLAEVEGWMD